MLWCVLGLLGLNGCVLPGGWWGAHLPTGLRLATPDVAYRNLAEAQGLLRRAHWASRCGDERSVDWYFEAARLAWHELEAHSHGPGRSSAVAHEVYHSAVAELVSQGQRFGRLHPGQGLRLGDEFGGDWIPVVQSGEGWDPTRFDELQVAGLPHSKSLNRYHVRPGLGVTVSAIRYRRQGESFLPPRQVASATVVLRPMSEPSGLGRAPMVLEIHDPMHSTQVDWGTHGLPLAADYSAPIQLALANNRNLDRLRAFVQPWQTRPDQVGLVMIEPYQPGKIPVLFVHGLFSDRYTWANVLNELRVEPDLRERYQVWGYQYPTGEPFLRSAARLRRELATLRRQLDPRCADPALDQIVIIGHSMGGLVGKLQVTHSDDQLWRAIASRPLDQIVIDPQGRQNLAEMLYFEPSPAVSRIVFIGTPHRGSGLAQRGIGRLASCLVEESAETRERHRQVLAANPGVFSAELSQRIPNSIDLLEPSSDLLQAIERLPIDPQVPRHSIVGRGCWTFMGGDSDGVVPLESALIEDATSQTAVETRHTRMTGDPRVIAELMRILREHAAMVDAVAPEVIWEPGDQLDLRLDAR